MNTTGTHTETVSHEKAPLRPLLTVLHLAALGIVGTTVIGLVVGHFAFGISFIVLFGLGLIILAGTVYVLYAIGWFEVERIRNLYGIQADALQWIPRTQSGFGGYIKSLWRNFISGRMWAALGSFVSASILGVALVGLVRWFFYYLIMAFAPLTELEHINLPFNLTINSTFGPLLLLISLLCLVLIWLLVYLHRLITTGIIGAVARRNELVTAVHQKTVEREGAVRAAELERTRLERDLHDGVQPRLVSIGMTLGLAQQKLDDDPEAAKKLLEEAHGSTKTAITELRQLSRGVYASVLDDRGLDAALSALVGRSHIPVVLDVRLPAVAAILLKLQSTFPLQKG